MIIAHRGASEELAEHTLAAYERAIAAGADALECDVRLTADGQVRNCLFSNRETDLRGPLRSGATDEQLAALIRGEMWRKAPGHGIGRADFHQPDRPMSAIGG